VSGQKTPPQIEVCISRLNRALLLSPFVSQEWLLNEVFGLSSEEIRKMSRTPLQEFTESVWEEDKS